MYYVRKTDSKEKGIYLHLKSDLVNECIVAYEGFRMTKDGQRVSP